MFPKFLKRKEKGQSLIEYALVLVLVAIVVFACLLAFSTINKSSSSSAPSNTLLNNAPIIGASEVHPLHVSLSDADRRNYREKVYEYGCNKMSVSSDYSIRAGTEYADTSVIRIKRLNDNYYSFCIDVKGAGIHIVYELVKNPK